MHHVSSNDVGHAQAAQPPPHTRSSSSVVVTQYSPQQQQPLGDARGWERNISSGDALMGQAVATTADIINRNKLASDAYDRATTTYPECIPAILHKALAVPFSTTPDDGIDLPASTEIAIAQARSFTNSARDEAKRFYLQCSNAPVTEATAHTYCAAATYLQYILDPPANERAVRLMTSAADLGSPVAQYFLGMRQLKLPREDDPNTPATNFNAPRFGTDGYGTDVKTENLQLAIVSFEKSFEGGYNLSNDALGVALLTLGLRYERGVDLSQSTREAIACFNRAKSYGNARAEYHLNRLSKRTATAIHNGAAQQQSPQQSPQQQHQQPHVTQSASLTTSRADHGSQQYSTPPPQQQSQHQQYQQPHSVQQQQYQPAHPAQQQQQRPLQPIPVDNVGVAAAQHELSAEEYYALGQQYEYGTAVVQDVNIAVTYYSNAAESGHVEGARCAARLLERVMGDAVMAQYYLSLANENAIHNTSHTSPQPSQQRHPLTTQSQQYPHQPSQYSQPRRNLSQPDVD